MAYSKRIHEEAEAELLRRRSQAQREADARLEALLARCPEARDVRSRMAQTASGAAKAVLKGGNVREQLLALKEENLALQARFAALLAENGMVREDIEPHFTCTICEDTGYVDGRICACHKALLKRLAYESLNRVSPLTLSSFESFSLDVFSDEPARELGYKRSYRAQMEKILAYMRHYADTFSAQSGSLLLKGGTGLGKTHLSLAVAAKAIEKEFGVVYGTANQFASSLERERFQQTDEDAGDTFTLLCTADLLVIDDLGMEPKSSYTATMFHNIVDTRLMRRLPTIVSTNLTEEEIGERYAQRFLSRLLGYFDPLEFVGSDYRLRSRTRRRERDAR